MLQFTIGVEPNSLNPDGRRNEWAKIRDELCPDVDGFNEIAGALFECSFEAKNYVLGVNLKLVEVNGAYALIAFKGGFEPDFSFGCHNYQ